MEEKNELIIIEKNESRKRIFSRLLTFIIASTLFIISDIFFKICTYSTYKIQPYSCVFQIFFGIIIYTLILAITKKSSKATIICYIFIYIINIINQIKISFISEPLYFSDIKFLGNLFNLTGLISENISFPNNPRYIMIYSLYLFILQLIIFLNLKFNLEIKKMKVRIATIIVDIILIILLFFPNSYTKELYLKIFFNSGAYVDFNSYTTNLSYYERNGLINGMYGIVLNSKFVEPDNYNEEILNDMLESTQEKNNEKIGKPNILVIFSESFWDVDQLSEVKFNQEVTANFNKLKSEGKFINLITPSYGGMSENVTFEFVTGGNMNYFPKGYIPVMSLYSQKNATSIPSLIKVLKNNNYYSKIIFGKDYYDSRDTYFKVGFDDYREITTAGYGSSWITDENATNILINEIKSNSKEQPWLYLLATLESHMPFYKDKYDEYNISIIDSKLEENMNEVLQAYAQGIYNADQQLGRLYEYIKSYNEPTILIFMSDHLPYLYTANSGKNVIFELDYFNTDDKLLNEYRKYNTQALILANFEIDNLDIPNYIGTDLFLNCIVNQLDIENEQYYEWLYNTTDIISGYNRYVSIDKDGNIYDTNELSGKMKEVYDSRNSMQYKLFMSSK